MKLLKTSVRDCLKPWVLMELCSIVPPCIAFCVLGFGCSQREFAERFFILIFGGSATAVINLVGYSAMYFLLSRFLSDKQRLLFISYLAGIACWLLDHVLKVLFQMSGIFMVPATLALIVWIFEWILCACFAFFVSFFLKSGSDVFRKINEMFWKITRFGCWVGGLSCLLLHALLIRFCFSSGR